MSHAIPVFIAIVLCLTAAGAVSWHMARPNPGTRAHFSRLDWQVWRTTAWLHLHVYAWRWTARRWYLMLRARFVRTARPDGPPLIPASGAARCRPGSAGLPNLDHILPALSAKLEAARTRDDLKVIHAGGMLLPDRPRATYEPGPFRIPPYYLKYEAEQAERRYLA